MPKKRHIITYRARIKAKAADLVWHWMDTCSNWPGHDLEFLKMPIGQRPKVGELCNECIAKEANDPSYVKAKETKAKAA